MTSFVQPTVRRSLFRVVFWMLCLLSTGSLAAFFAFGRTMAEKFVSELIMPCGLIWLLLLGASLLAFSLKSRAAGWVGILIFLTFSTLGNGHIADLLSGSLEAEFRDIQPLEQEPFDRVILLGGGARVGGNGVAQGNPSGDRVIVAASMYHHSLTPTLICTGTGIKGLNGGLPGPAELSRDTLMALGVPESAIEFSEGRNTSEELAALAKSIGDSNQRIGIVTSAWHMPRVLKLADQQGLKLHPLPADFLNGPTRQQSVAEKIKAFIPQVDALNTTTKSMKEYIAMAVGR